MPVLWLVLPTYAEAGTLAATVAGALAALARVDPDHHVLVVDDASPDGTGALADALAARHPAVEVLHRPAKAGLGPALTAGFHHALASGAELVLSMDADGSHDPADLPRLVAAAARADLVLGSRYVPGGGIRGWSRPRRWISRAGSSYARILLGAEVRDLTSGFRCVRAPVLAALLEAPLAASGYAVLIELTHRAFSRGYSVAEVPILFTERQAGSSKMTAAIALEAAWRVPALRARRCSARRDSGWAGIFAPPGGQDSAQTFPPAKESTSMERQLGELPDDHPEAGGAEGGDGGAADAPPGLPSQGDDDSAFGDTDQVSQDPA